MHPTPLPATWKGRRIIIGPPDPTRDDLRPCEYAVVDSIEWPGRADRYLARIELTDQDRAAVSAGAVLWLELDGGEVPWGLRLTLPEAGVPE